MAMITEDHVSFETAKLLKEKGFDEPCTWLYDNQGRKQYASDYHSPWPNSELAEDEWSCCTFQVAMKWLREMHNWTICISPYWPEGDMRNKLTWYYDIHSLIDNRSFRESSYTDNYTEACEAAIKYSLENLI